MDWGSGGGAGGEGRRGAASEQRGPLGSEGQRSSKDNRSSTSSTTAAKKKLTRDGDDDDEQLVEILQRLDWNSSVALLLLFLLQRYGPRSSITEDLAALRVYWSGRRFGVGWWVGVRSPAQDAAATA